MIRAGREERQAPEVGRKSPGLHGGGSFARMIGSFHTERGAEILGGRNSRCGGAEDGQNGGSVQAHGVATSAYLEDRFRTQSEAKQELGNSFPRSPSPNEMPSFLKGQGPKGLPNIKQEDLQIQ